jgi:hypothetical protein
MDGGCDRFRLEAATDGKLQDDAIATYRSTSYDPPLLCRSSLTQAKLGPCILGRCQAGKARTCALVMHAQDARQDRPCGCCHGDNMSFTMVAAASRGILSDGRSRIHRLTVQLDATLCCCCRNSIRRTCRAYSQSTAEEGALVYIYIYVCGRRAESSNQFGLLP